jgi:CHAT domain-containing protein
MTKILFLLTGCFFYFTVSVCGQCLTKNNSDWQYIVSIVESHTLSNKDKLAILSADLDKIKNSSCKNDSSHAFLLQIIAEVHIGLGDYKNTVKYLQQSIDVIAANIGRPDINPKRLIGLYYWLSVWYDYLDNVPEKMKAVNNCIDFATRLKMTSDISCVRSMYTRVKYSFDIGDYKRSIDDALICEQFAREYSKTVKKGSKADTTARGIVSSCLGWYVKVQLLLNNFEAAEQFLINKLEEYKKAGLQNYLGLVYSQLATIQLHKQEYANALRTLTQGLAASRKEKNYFMCKQIVNMIASAIYFNHFSDWDKALYYYRNALTYKNTNAELAKTDIIESLNIYTNMANVFVQKGLFDSAFIYFHLAFDQLGPGTDEEKIARASPSDISAFEKVYYIENLLISKAHAFQEKYKVTRQPGDIEKAIRVYKVADHLLDITRAVQVDIDSKIFWRSDNHRLYEQAIEACYLTGNTTEAFYFFEKSRAVLLTDQLAEQHWLGLEDISKQSRIKKDVQQLERELESDTTDLESGRHGEIQTQLFSLRQELDKLEQLIKIRTPLYSQTTGGGSVSLPDAKNNLLKDHQGLLEIFAGDSLVYILLITSGDTYFKKINKTDFDKAVALYISYFQERDRVNNDFTGFRTASHNLYKLLFENNKVQGGRIIISPDGGHYFPFEALISNNSQQDPVYFLADHAVSYTYSASYLVNNFTSTATKLSGNFLGIAPVNYPAAFHLPPLSGSDLSLGKIGSYIPNSHNLLAGDASRNRFLQQFNGYKIIQLYTHSSDSSDRKEPVIYFADSSLYLSDLIPERIPATRLIVLSACETANGKLYQGEGVFSFSRGFAAMGVPSSVSNLWAVDNLSTYQLTEYFYKYLSEGLPFDVALQKAKLEFILTSSKEKQLPYFWAAPVLTGQSSAITIEKAFPWKYVWITTAFAALSFLVWWKFNKKRNNFKR